MSHGLIPSQRRITAFNFYSAKKIAVPPNWTETRPTPEDCISEFIKRNETLSYRLPESTRQARASGFNAQIFAQFFNNLVDVLTRFRNPTTRIWNTDERGIPTVLTPANIIATKGNKQYRLNVLLKIRCFHSYVLLQLKCHLVFIPPARIFSLPCPITDHPDVLDFSILLVRSTGNIFVNSSIIQDPCSLFYQQTHSSRSW